MKRRKVPSYRIHKASGQAVVRLDGKDYYLGVFGTPESHQKYQRLLAEWLAGSSAPSANGLTVAEGVARYARYVEGRGHGRGQLQRIKASLAVAVKLYGSCDVSEFRGRALKACRVQIVEAGYNRRHVNQRVACIKQCWRWLLSEELAPADAVHSVLAVAGLRRGESEAPEPKRIMPVSPAIVEATLPHLDCSCACAVRVLRATGARAGEVLGMRAEAIERTSEDLWLYKPEHHKTANRGHVRTLFLGPQAIAAVQERGVAEGYLFPPFCARTERRYASVTSFSQLIRRTCLRAGIEPWHPLQLRHAFATHAVAEHGWEVGRILLGHRHVQTTQIYAEEELAKVIAIVRKIG